MKFTIGTVSSNMEFSETLKLIKSSLLYADEMRIAGKMSDGLFEAVRTDKAMSVFDIDRSGEDGKKHPVNGHDLDYHVVYSAHTADMFRIYYYRDKELGKIVIGYIGKHL